MGIDYLNHSYLLYTLMERVRRCPLNWVALIMTSSSFLVGGRLENSCMSLLFWFRSFSFHPQCRFWRKYGIMRCRITSRRSTFSFLGQYCRIFQSSYLGWRTWSRILSPLPVPIVSLVMSVIWVSICICFSQRLRKWPLYCDLEHLIWVFEFFSQKWLILRGCVTLL